MVKKHLFVTETEGEQWLPGARRRRDGEFCLMNREFQFCKMKNALEMDGGDGLHPLGEESKEESSDK